MKTPSGQIIFETVGELRDASEAMSLVAPTSPEAELLLSIRAFDIALWAGNGRERKPDDFPFGRIFSETDYFSPSRVIEAMRTVTEATEVIDPEPLYGESSAEYQRMLERNQKRLIGSLRSILTAYDAETTAGSKQAK